MLPFLIWVNPKRERSQGEEYHPTNKDREKVFEDKIPLNYIDNDCLISQAKNTEFTVKFTQLHWLDKFIDSIKVHSAPSQMCFRATVKRQQSSFSLGAVNMNNILLQQKILLLKEIKS